MQSLSGYAVNALRDSDYGRIWLVIRVSKFSKYTLSLSLSLLYHYIITCIHYFNFIVSPFPCNSKVSNGLTPQFKIKTFLKAYCEQLR